MFTFHVAWVLVSSATQVQQQIILVPDYLPDYLSVSYDYDSRNVIVIDGMAIANNTDFQKIVYVAVDNSSFFISKINSKVSEFIDDWTLTMAPTMMFLSFFFFLHHFDKICSSNIFKTTDQKYYQI